MPNLFEHCRNGVSWAKPKIRINESKSTKFEKNISPIATNKIIFLPLRHCKWKDAGVVELARLESVYTSKGYQGFESPSFRQSTKQTL